MATATLPPSPDQPAIERATLTVEEAGRLLGVGRQAAYEGVRTGAIPALRIGRRLVVPRPALDRLLTSGQSSTSEGRSAA
jgi:excisionase family DNA binding protein